MPETSEDKKIEENQEVKVNDRRRFESDGTPKAETDTSPGTRREENKGESKEASSQAEVESEHALPAEFPSLVLSLAASAQSALGVAPNPMTGKVEKNLLQAKHAVDLLGVLAEKTKGNLTEEEDKLLKALLFDLRLQYVEASKAKNDDAI